MFINTDINGVNYTLNVHYYNATIEVFEYTVYRGYNEDGKGGLFGMDLSGFDFAVNPDTNAPTSDDLYDALIDALFEIVPYMYGTC